MAELRDSTYARELARATLEINGDEARIERLYIKDLDQEEIRFSWWPGGKIAPRALDLPEEHLLLLLERAIEKSVFTPKFLEDLKALFNRVAK